MLPPCFDNELIETLSKNALKVNRKQKSFQVSVFGKINMKKFSSPHLDSAQCKLFFYEFFWVCQSYGFPRRPASRGTRSGQLILRAFHAAKSNGCSRQEFHPHTYSVPMRTRTSISAFGGLRSIQLSYRDISVGVNLHLELRRPVFYPLDYGSPTALWVITRASKGEL